MEKYFTIEFWKQFVSILTHWLVTDLISIFIIILLLIITLRIAYALVKKLKAILLKRMAYRNEEPDIEVEKRLNTLMGVLRKTLSIVIWSIFIMIFLEKININIIPILSAAGIVGLAVGFGSQELVRDFIAGFFILLEDGIRTGDVVTLNGTSGSVEKIELRTITLRDSSGVVHIFQNGKINTISNMTKGWSAMVFNIGVSYKEDLTQVMRLMKEVGDKMFAEAEYQAKMLDTMEVSGLNDFGDSALVIRGRIRTKPGQQWGVGREYRKRLKEAFDENNIEIPFPHQTIYLGEEEDSSKLSVNADSNKVV
ncbi:MAG: mechanosensitive ion channel family protein [Dysgonamonadaceae bacterium]|nr:mechanosensitive ion channel family protein [Dysgonamonadaceae bacterium]MDD4729208.1 mechanosensitive ion channel family protein [Dysgonamonadaceae bacterium]